MPSPTVSPQSASAVLSPLDRWLPDLEDLYWDLVAVIPDDAIVKLNPVACLSA